MIGLLYVPVLSFAQGVTINEYAVPTPPSAPNGITTGPDGALWFAESSSKGGLSEIGRITTAGVISEYPLSTCCAPELITAGPDGALWFTKSFSNEIGRITTAGVITEYSVPSAASYPVGIVSGPDGALWFTEFMGNRIGRITTLGTVTEYPLVNADSGPNYITVGPDSALWFTESFGNKIGRITTDGVITEYPLPVNTAIPNGYPTGIASGPDDRIWFVDYVGNNIGAITINGVITEYPVTTPPPPPGSLNLAGITMGPDGALWFTEVDANKIGRITTGGSVTEYVVPTPNSFPLQITLGPDGALWFTEGAADKIGQVVVPDATAPVITVSATPKTLWPPKGQLVSVRVSGTITDGGSGVNLSSTAYSVTDEYGEFQPTGTISLGAGRAYSFTVLLRASRQGTDLNGHRYTITVRAKDNAGNGGSETTVVTVPHDQRNLKSAWSATEAGSYDLQPAISTFATEGAHTSIGSKISLHKSVMIHSSLD